MSNPYGTFQQLQLDKLTEISTNTASSGGGDASSANQTTQINHLSTIEGDTTSLDGKISKGSDDVILSATGAQQTLVYGRNDFNNNLYAVKVGTDGNLHVFDADITSGNDATLNNAQQVLCYGRDSAGNLDALLVDNNGHLKVIVETVENKGSQSNIQDGNLSFGSVSSSVDVSDFNHAVFLYEDTNISTFDNPVVEVSVDNTNFYKLSTQPIINTGTSKREGTQEYKLHGVRYLRIRNDSTADNFTNAKATIVGTPN